MRESRSARLRTKTRCLHCGYTEAVPKSGLPCPRSPHPSAIEPGRFVRCGAIVPLVYESCATRGAETRPREARPDAASGPAAACDACNLRQLDVDDGRAVEQPRHFFAGQRRRCVASSSSGCTHGRNASDMGRVQRVDLDEADLVPVAGGRIAISPRRTRTGLPTDPAAAELVKVHCFAACRSMRRRRTRIRAQALTGTGLMPGHGCSVSCAANRPFRIVRAVAQKGRSCSVATKSRTVPFL